MVYRDNNGRFEKKLNVRDLSGMKFGFLIAENLYEIRNRKAYWNCKCTRCGNHKIIRGDALVGNKTISCGCYHRDNTYKVFNLKNLNGISKHPLYPIWNSMKQRCENEKSISYIHYGGRGISLCREWHDVRKFIEWSEKNGYKKGLTIERIDVNGNYCPENCCWITRYEQSLNRTDSTKVTFDGITKNITIWVRELDIPWGEFWSAHSKGINYTDLIAKYY